MARCRGCGNVVTWAEQRRQFGRLVGWGVTADVAWALLPRCPKCVTSWRRNAIAKQAGRATCDARRNIQRCILPL
jgi:hypothetical protein